MLEENGKNDVTANEVSGTTEYQRREDQRDAEELLKNWTLSYSRTTKE